MNALAAFESQDYPRAITLLTPLAQSGDVLAQCLLGNCYQLGLGTAPNLQQAMDWYRAAAEQGDGLAANNLAVILLTSNRQAADEWFARSRALGFIHAPVNGDYLVN